MEARGYHVFLFYLSYQLIRQILLTKEQSCIKCIGSLPRRIEQSAVIQEAQTKCEIKNFMNKIKTNIHINMVW